MTDVAQTLHEYCNFSPKNGIVWIITVLTRKKDNAPGYHNFLRRYILKKDEDIPFALDEIRRLAKDPSSTYRLYVSVNGRDCRKAAFSFMSQLCRVCRELCEGQEDGMNKATNLGSRWKTELQQRRNRATKRFMLDIDEDNAEVAESITKYLAKVSPRVYFCRRTVSGYAVVFDACDTRDLMETYSEYELDLQRDSMVFMEQWTGRHPQAPTEPEDLILGKDVQSLQSEVARLRKAAEPFGAMHLLDIPAPGPWKDACERVSWALDPESHSVKEKETSHVSTNETTT